MEVETENAYDPNVYVITEKGWEYNDSNYYSLGSYGRPSEAFIIEKLAIEYCDDLNFKWFVSNLGGYENVAHYCEDGVLYDDVKEVIDSVEHLSYNKEENIFESDNLNRLKKEQVINLMRELNVIQYEVVRVRLRG